jgi:hypothetical protein
MPSNIRLNSFGEVSCAPAVTTASVNLGCRTSRMPQTLKLTTRRPIITWATQDFAKARMAASIEGVSWFCSRPDGRGQAV